MEMTAVQDFVREQLGLRLGPEMSRYVLSRLKQPDRAPMLSLPIIAIEARTGLPVNAEIPLQRLAAEFDHAASRPASIQTS